jgi:hypothetical protein
MELPYSLPSNFFFTVQFLARKIRNEMVTDKANSMLNSAGILEHDPSSWNKLSFIMHKNAIYVLRKLMAKIYANNGYLRTTS